MSDYDYTNLAANSMSLNLLSSILGKLSNLDSQVASLKDMLNVQIKKRSDLEANRDELDQMLDKNINDLEKVLIFKLNSYACFI